MKRIALMLTLGIGLTVTAMAEKILCNKITGEIISVQPDAAIVRTGILEGSIVMKLDQDIHEVWEATDLYVELPGDIEYHANLDLPMSTTKLNTNQVTLVRRVWPE